MELFEESVVDLSESEDRAYGISRDRIEKIIIRYEEGLKDPYIVSPAELITLSAVSYYEKTLGLRMANRPVTPEGLTQEKAFVEAVELTEGCELTPVDARTLSSGVLAMRYLMLSGKLDELYKSYLFEIYGDLVEDTGQDEQRFRQCEEALIRDVEPHVFGSDLGQDTKDAIKRRVVAQTKAEVAFSFLRRLEAKNEQRVGNVTIGAEYEYGDPYARLLFSIEKDVKELNWTIEWPSDELLEANDALYRAAPTKPGMAKFYPFRDTQEEQFGTRELVTYPTRKPLEQIRDILYMRASGLVEGTLVVHETYGGVELSPRHLEVCDAKEIVTASGFDTDSELEQELVAAEGKGKLLATFDRYPKPAQINGEYYYFPQFRPRTSDEMKALEGNTFNTTDAVEWRGLPNIKNEISQTDFIRSARRVKYQVLAQEAIHSLQLDESERTAADIERAKLWKEHVAAFRDIKQRYGMRSVSDSNKFFKLSRHPEVFREDGEYSSAEVAKLQGRNPYIHLLASLRRESAFNPEFRSEVRRLIIDFQAKVEATFETME